MAFQIRIQPDSIRAAAHKQRALVARAEAACGDLREIMNLLDQAWDGVASEAALDAIENLMKKSDGVAGAIDKSADRLIHVAKVFESVDSNEPVSPFEIIEFFDAIVMRPLIPPSIVIPKLVSVRIVPGQVREMGHRLENMTAVYNELVEEFYVTVGSLEASWEGRAYDKYMEMVNEIRVGMYSISESLEELAIGLIRAADRFEEIDNSL